MTKRMKINIIHTFTLIVIETALFFITRPEEIGIYFMLWCAAYWGLMLVNIFGGLGMLLDMLGFYDSNFYKKKILSSEEEKQGRRDPLNSNTNLVYMFLAIVNIVVYMVV